MLNNSPEKTSQVSDKLWLARWLEKSGFPFIKTYASAEEMHSADDLRFPFIVKPRKGAGGVGCRRVEEPVRSVYGGGSDRPGADLGQAASVSVIGNGQRGACPGRQRAAHRRAPGRAPKVSGTVGTSRPSTSPHCNIAGMAEEIIARLGLVGSNGVDFLLTETGPVVVEVNSRFQGSLDTVEMATGHECLPGSSAVLPGKTARAGPAARCFAGRAIIYASRDLEVKTDLSRPWTADVPRPGSRIARDDPILSILAKGSESRSGSGSIQEESGSANCDDRVN